MAYRDVILADSPVAYWRLGESSGTTAFDETANSHDGTYGGGFTLAQTGALVEDADTSVLLHTSSGHVLVSNHADFQIETGSLEAWIKTQGAVSSYQGIVIKQFAYGLFLKDGDLIAFDWVVGDHETNEPLDDGNWHHVVWTFDDGVTNGSHVYVDGVLVHSFTHQHDNHSEPLNLGTGWPDGSVQNFNGFLDEVAVYNYALTAGQVEAHFDAAFTPNPPDGTYVVRFTPTDTHSTSTDEIAWQVRTAASGGGNLVEDGTATAGVEFTSDPITDPYLVTGTNTRWLRLTDGAGNVYEDSFDVEAEAGSLILLGAIGPTAIVHTPGAEAGPVSIAANHVAATGSVHSPAIVPGEVALVGQHIDATETVHTPLVFDAQRLAMQHIAAADVLHQPNLRYDQAVAAQHVAPSETTPAPGILYDQAFVLQHIEPAEAVYAPMVAVGVIALAMQQIDPAEVVYEPVVMPGDVVIVAPHIAPADTVHTLRITQGQVLVVPHVGATDQVFAPDIAIGAMAIGIQHIDPTETVFAAQVVVEALLITAQHIGSSETLFQFIINSGPALSTIPNISPRRQQPRFYLTIYPPVGSLNSRNRLDVIDINPEITGLNWQSSWPGGFSQLTAGHDHNDGWTDRRLAHPLIPRELTTSDYARVLLSDGPLTFWEGRLGDADRSPSLRRTIRARGYGYTALSDNPFMSDSATEATSGAILRTAIASAAPAIRTAFGDLFIDPSVTHTPVEWRYLFPLQILDQIHKEGDTAGNLMDWGVWENRTLVLLPRVAPARPDYWLPLDDRFVSGWKRIPPERGRVWVKHNVGGSETVTGPVTDPRFSDSTGFQRSIILNAGEMSAASALRFAQTYLRFHSVARYAGEITIGPDDHLVGWGGRQVPGYLARAGQWVKVGDYEPLVIIACEHNPNVPRTRLRLGERIDSYQSRVAATMRDNELRKQGTNPVGGRLR